MHRKRLLAESNPLPTASTAKNVAMTTGFVTRENTWIDSNLGDTGFLVNGDQTINSTNLTIAVDGTGSAISGDAYISVDGHRFRVNGAVSADATVITVDDPGSDVVIADNAMVYADVKEARITLPSLFPSNISALEVVCEVKGVETDNSIFPNGPAYVNDDPVENILAASPTQIFRVDWRYSSSNYKKLQMTLEGNATTLPSDTIVKVYEYGETGFCVDAMAMKPSRSNGADVGSVEDCDNSSPSYDTLDFDETVPEVAEFRLPRGDYRSGLKFDVEWSTETNAGNVVWGLSGVAIGNDDADTLEFGAEITVTDGVEDANDIMVSPLSDAVTIANAGENNGVFMKIRRVSDSDDDTMTGDAKLIALNLEM